MIIGLLNKPQPQYIVIAFSCKARESCNCIIWLQYNLSVETIIIMTLKKNIAQLIEQKFVPLQKFNDQWKIGGMYHCVL